MKEINTIPAIIDLLGGNETVANALGVTASAVGNWRGRKLPSDTFLAIQGLLMAKGATAPAHLWGMREITKEPDIK